MRSGTAWLRPGRATPLAVGVFVIVATAWAGPPYRDGPPPGHTGGFGEPLCAECHFGGPVNADPGSLRIGAPDVYESGGSHTLTVRLRHPDMQAGGFQLAIRFADGPRTGMQAGTLAARTPGDSAARTAITVDGGVEYAHQTVAGAALSGSAVAEWTVEWQAPDSGAPVIVHVSGNAANDDASEFGDLVYAAETWIHGPR